MRCLSCLAPWLAALALLVSPALAQTPSAQDRATARLLAEEADKKTEAGDHKGALELFERADAIFPAPTLKVAIARAHLQLGHIIEAHELLLDVARSTPQPGEPGPWADARVAARQLATELAPRIPRIEIRLEGLRASVLPVVTLDGRLIPNESLNVVRPINVGAHRVRAEAEGYLPSEQKIQMAEGELYRLTLKLFPEPSAAASGSSRATPPPRPSTEPTSSAPSGIGSPTLAIAGFTGAGVFTLTGTVLGLMVFSRVDELKKVCREPPGMICPESRRDDVDSASRLATLSNLSFGLAAVGLGVGLYGLLSDPPAPTSGRTAPRVRLGVGPGSLLLDGSF